MNLLVMKKLLIVFVLVVYTISNAQNPDPELFRTWYLTSIEVDLGDEIFVENISP